MTGLFRTTTTTTNGAATMKESTAEIKDPICGMTVDTSTALHSERDGTTFNFCSEHCQKQFLSAPSGTKPEKKAGGCCCG